MFIVTKNMHKITTNEKNFLRSSYFINKINPVKKIIFFIKAKVIHVLKVPNFLKDIHLNLI